MGQLRGADAPGDPDGRWLPLDPGHRIFDTFFNVEEIALPNPYNHHLAASSRSTSGSSRTTIPRGG